MSVYPVPVNPPPYSAATRQTYTSGNNVYRTVVLPSDNVLDPLSYNCCTTLLSVLVACIAFSFFTVMGVVAARNRKMIALFGQGLPNYSQNMISLGLCASILAIISSGLFFSASKNR